MDNLRKHGIFGIMQITYLGHSAFKLKGTSGTVVTDPYHKSVGFQFPRLTADLVTISHDHQDHNAIENVLPSAKKEKVFLVSQVGEYEVAGISVFGSATYHDTENGMQRGPNNVFTILLDGLRICHLGDLGHELSNQQADAIGNVDVLFCPVGGVYTIDSGLAVKTIRRLEPSIVIPMHYKTPNHDQKIFGEMAEVGTFLKTYGIEVQPVANLEVNATRLPEETEVSVLVPSTG